MYILYSLYSQLNIALSGTGRLIPIHWFPFHMQTDSLKQESSSVNNEQLIRWYTSKSLYITAPLYPPMVYTVLVLTRNEVWPNLWR